MTLYQATHDYENRFLSLDSSEINLFSRYKEAFNKIRKLLGIFTFDNLVNSKKHLFYFLNAKSIFIYLKT